MQHSTTSTAATQTMRRAWRAARVATREAVDRRPGRTPLVAITRATKLRPRSRAVLSCVTVGGDSYSSVRRRGGRNGRRCRRGCRGPRRRRNEALMLLARWPPTATGCHSRGGAPAARARRRRRTPSFILRRRSWCVAPVAAVPAGEGWARTARGPVGRDWALERCTAPVRALLGPIVVPLLHGVVEVASRGRRLGP